MKILCLADLHIGMDKVSDKLKDKYLRSLSLDGVNLVLIAGDVFEYHIKNPHKRLARLFEGIPVVYCLGNHEFFNRSVAETLWIYEGQCRFKHRYDVHCLDIEGHYDIGGIRIVGNFLGYDGSMSTVRGQRMEDWGHVPGTDYIWADRLIQNYLVDCQPHTEACQRRIKRELDGFDGKKILLTHCVPHRLLNGHIDAIGASGVEAFNYFSGLDKFLETVNVDYAICGHTHKRVAGIEVNGCKCVNVGNEYSPPYIYHMLEI